MDRSGTLKCMNNLALTYWNRDQSEEADRLFIQVFENLKMKLGADHPDRLTSMANRAFSHWGLGRWE